MVCKVCKSHLGLLLQLHANLPEQFQNHERRLFVLGCRRKTCQRKNGCIRAFRNVKYLPIQRLDDTVTSYHNINSSCKHRGQLGDAVFGIQSTLEPPHNSNPFAVNPKPLRAEPSAYSNQTKPNPALKYETQFVTEKSEIPQILLSSSSRNNIFQPSLRNLDHDTSLPDRIDVVQQESALPKPFPRYYLEADFESLDNTAVSSTSLNLMDLELSLPSSGTQPLAIDDAETFESTLDKVFQRFADRLAQNPLQVLRYEFGGIPILYSDKDDVGRRLTGGTSALQDGDKADFDPLRARQTPDIPLCENCGSKRKFEMQLTPYAISLLEADETGLDGMEWGTIIVGVCESDCIGQTNNDTVGYTEEWVGVQWEET